MCSESTNIKGHEAYTNLTKASVELEKAISSQMKWEDVEKHLNEEQRKMYKTSVGLVSHWSEKFTPRELWLVGLNKSLNAHSGHPSYVDFQHQPRLGMSTTILEKHKLAATDHLLRQFKNHLIFHIDTPIYNVRYQDRNRGKREEQSQFRESVVNYLFACLYIVATQSGHAEEYKLAADTYRKAHQEAKNIHAKQEREQHNEMKRDQNKKVVDTMSQSLSHIAVAVETAIEQIKDHQSNSDLRMYLTNTWEYLKTCKCLYTSTSTSTEDVDTIRRKIEEAIFPDKTTEELEKMRVVYLHK